MKTLDEVIEEVERCHCNITDGCGTCEEFRKCFFCVRDYPSCDPLNDALHYLWEYRDMRERINNLPTERTNGVLIPKGQGGTLLSDKDGVLL